MTRFTTSLLLFATCASFSHGQLIFNGQDLDGWEGNPDLWRAEDGMIVGETTEAKKTDGNTFLIWKGGELGDFTLSLKARVTGENNSGIQYRSKIVDPEKWVVGGYQMDMHPAQNYLGMLYEEKGRGITAERGQQVMIDRDGTKHVIGKVDTDEQIDIAQWNDYRIMARGNRIEHYVNNKLTARIIDNQPEKQSFSGTLALQLHAGPPMRVEFKNIRLRNVPVKNLATPAAQVKPAKRSQPKSLAKISPAPTPWWIWTTDPAETETIYARRQWTLSAPPKIARLTITCDNGFTAFINGKKLGSGDEWSNRYQFDLKKHLTNGDNVLAIEANNEGSTGGLVAQIEMVDAKNNREVIVTDKQWYVSSKKAEGWMAPSINTDGWAHPVIVGKMGDGPWGDVFSGKSAAAGQNPSAPPRVPEGFEIEKLYDVPKGEQGSWVSMAVDEKGRLYCSDQGKQGVFRITVGEGDSEPLVESVAVEISGAHGMLWAFDSLYVCVNEGQPQPAGLYRLTDSDGDDQLDKMLLLRRFQGGGEHGPHAVELSPDGQSLFVLGGNHTKTPDHESSVVVPNYGEDQLLPRSPDARGHAANVRAPGGWIARTDKDGKSFELYSCGFRNQYDIAFNADGEMFTYDSDMEWDIGSPWYRPTRIYHVTSGSEFGWRTGTGKFPTWYPDTLPPSLEVGPGSPTGVVSGLGAKFPAKYQDAIYAFDWTYGTIYAMHLTPNGGSYDATKEEFVVGVPLNVTDGVIGKDGNFYFAVGGRGTDSALYRVKYVGDAPTDWVPRGNKLAFQSREIRKEMEAFHGKQVAGSVDKIWPILGHEDRRVRFAARVALEHQPVAEWADRALAEQDTQTALSALLALSRQGGKEQQMPLLDAASKLPAAEMDEAQKLELLRVLGLCIIRMGIPPADVAGEMIAAITPQYPSTSDALNRELVAMLVTLGDPLVVAKTVPMLSQEAAGAEGLILSDELLKRSGYGSAFAQTQESNPQRQQIWYAYALKNATTGWTPGLRKQFFTWFAKARNFKGGNSFGGFIENFRTEALTKISDPQERAAMDELSKQPIALIPAGYENARKIDIGTKVGMKFDKETLEAKAGEKIAIVLLNNDPTGIMHNLAVCTPGSREKVVTAALTIGPAAIEQNFVPDIPEVLASTPQVAPGRKFTLYMTAPSEPGDYPYVCTYPGHGQLMHGVLKVTK